jgi:RimJ/RimL family protein N-acetyltransferase
VSAVQPGVCNVFSELFRGRLVRLTYQDADKDGDTLARWSTDSEYLRLLDSDAARPRPAKSLGADIARRAEREHVFAFNIRTLADDRFVGFVSLWVGNWASAEGRVGIGIGEAADRGRGYGTEAMQLLLRYAFAELNLARVGLEAFAANQGAIRSYQKAGFTLEGVQREWAQRDGRRVDVVSMGILRQEYQAAQTIAQPG